MKTPFSPKLKTLVPIAAVLIFVGIGFWALRLQSLQARDTIRKHDIEDIEKALNRYAKQHGEYPPVNSVSWCGTISGDSSKDIKKEIEDSLRKDKKYAKLDKKFPSDPVYGGTENDYTYWKTSPVSFELVAKLEADRNATRNIPCKKDAYDYSVVSFLRNQF